MSGKRQLRLNNVKNIRNSLAFLVREFYRNEGNEEINPYWYRTLATLMDLLLKAHGQERLEDFEKRIEKIEDLLDSPSEVQRIQNRRKAEND